MDEIKEKDSVLLGDTKKESSGKYVFSLLFASRGFIFLVTNTLVMKS